MGRPDERGFSILEALVAAALLAGALTVLLHVITLGAEQALRTELAIVASTLAQGKLEQLRASPFAFDESGGRIDGPDLAISSADAHLASIPPYVEHLDRFGAPAPADVFPAYVRRWSVTTHEGDPDTLLLVVCAEPRSHPGVRVIPACLWTIRTRQP